MEKQGFKVEMTDVEDLDSFKKQYKIPPHLWDCHTVLIGDYYIEGHVPFEAVNKLLAEQPDNVAGLALPNMPTGTPGMPGPKKGPFVVWRVYKNGTYDEFGRY